MFAYFPSELQGVGKPFWGGLARQDLNLECLDQNQVCYRLHHGPKYWRCFFWGAALVNLLANSMIFMVVACMNRGGTIVQGSPFRGELLLGLGAPIAAIRAPCSAKHTTCHHRSLFGEGCELYTFAKCLPSVQHSTFKWHRRHKEGGQSPFVCLKTVLGVVRSMWYCRMLSIYTYV